MALCLAVDGAWPRILRDEDTVTTTPGAPLRVAVTSDQHLVREAVQEALTSHGLSVTALPWPAERPVVGRKHGNDSADDHDVGLLLGELDRFAVVGDAQRMIRNVRTRWVVLTPAPPGPAWGAVLESGAVLVLPAATALDHLVHLLRAVAGGQLGQREEERLEMVAQWRSEVARRETLLARLDSLTPRQREVLDLLHDGMTVSRIASSLHVSEAAVRSQVKAVLRKLQVTSQVAAVAIVEQLRDGDVGEVAEVPHTVSQAD